MAIARKIKTLKPINLVEKISEKKPARIALYNPRLFSGFSITFQMIINSKKTLGTIPQKEK